MKKSYYISPNTTVKIVKIEYLLQPVSGGTIPVDPTPGDDEGTAKDYYNDFNPWED